LRAVSYQQYPYTPAPKKNLGLKAVFEL